MKTYKCINFTYENNLLDICFEFKYINKINHAIQFKYKDNGV